MEENNIENSAVNIVENKDNTQKQIAGAILIAGLLIAGAILLKGNGAQDKPVSQEDQLKKISLTIESSDYVLGSLDAKVTIVEYSDFQCKYCGKFHNEAEKAIRENYIANGKVSFIYRDYAFLGEQSIKAAEAARCAGDQTKFWEYHDYLFDHQGGESGVEFSNINLKSFAKNIGLNEVEFNQCFDSGKYAQAVAQSIVDASKIGVQSTPKAFILKNGKVVDMINGAEPSAMVIEKIEKALK
jgi:protein-disulfide isomerase